MSFDIIANNSTPNKFKLYDLSDHFKNKSATPPISTEQTNQNYNLNLSAQEVQAALDTAANMELEGTSFKFQWPWSKPNKEDANNDIPKKDTTRDGEIGASSQNGTGNCALLSAINALSYTEEGKQIIKNTLEYKENGDVVVHFKGVGDYTITKEEFDKIREEQEKADSRGKTKYSTGDDDMLILELALEKVFRDLSEADFMFEKSGLLTGYQSTEDIHAKQDDLLNGLDYAEILYLLTGKDSEGIVISTEKEKTLNVLDEYKNGSITLTCGTTKNSQITDVNGKNINIYGDHAYAIKNVTEDTVTVVNPWDSSKEITITKEDFLSVFASVKKCDLNSESINNIKYPDYIDENGNKIYKESCIGMRGYATLETIYDKNGAKTQETLIESDGKISVEKYYKEKADKTCYLSEKIENNTEATKGASIRYDENGNEKEYCLYEYDIAGNIKIMQFVGSKYHYQDIMERDLMNYSQFNVIEIWKLGALSDEKWEEVAQYLQQNPNATYDEIKENIN